MALISEDSKCAICGEPIGDYRFAEIFALTFWGMDHPLFSRLDDAVMHQECIDSWQHRDEFIAYFNQHFSARIGVNRSGKVVYCRGRVEQLLDRWAGWIILASSLAPIPVLNYGFGIHSIVYELIALFVGFGLSTLACLVCVLIWYE